MLQTRVPSYSFTVVQVDSSWNVMAHGDARVGKWRGNWRMEWVASTLYTTSQHGVSSITTADLNTSAASSRLNWRPRRFKWARPFRRKTKSCFCACVIAFQLVSTSLYCWLQNYWKSGLHSFRKKLQPFLTSNLVWQFREPRIEWCGRLDFCSQHISVTFRHCDCRHYVQYSCVYRVLVTDPSESNFELCCWIAIIIYLNSALWMPQFKKFASFVPLKSHLVSPPFYG